MINVLSVQNLGKSFGRNRVLDGVSFDIAEGEVAAVVGPSGAGKTTLLRIVAGLDGTFDGTVAISGVNYNDYFRSGRVAIVPQQYSNFPWLTVERNLLEALLHRQISMRNKKALIERQLAAVGLSGYEAHYPGQLSGGMQQRVALSRALLQQEPLICFDEPFSALDFLNRNALQDLVRQRIQAEHKTALFVSHDIEEALYISDRLLVLRDGKIVADVLRSFARSVDQSIKNTSAFIELKAHIIDVMTTSL